MSLYKYVAPDRVEIFKNGLIRFTQPSALNDPFEMKPHFEAIAPQGYFEKDLNNNRAAIMKQALSDEFITKAYSDFPDHMKRALPLETVLKIIKQNPAVMEQFLTPHLNRFIGNVTTIEKEVLLPIAKQELPASVNKNIGVLCLTAMPDHRLMWAHYAQSHEGFVLEFDDRHMYFHQQKFPADEINHLWKVIYVDERPSFPTLADMTLTALFLTKGKEWEYEEEWRMLRPLRDADEVRGDIYLFSIPPICITGIIFGCRMPEVKKEEVVQLLKNGGRFSHVKRYQAVMDEKRYGLNIVSSTI